MLLASAGACVDAEENQTKIEMTSITHQNPAQARMAAVTTMTRMLRQLFEVEREIVRTATTLIPRVGEPELKYLLCQHIWESAGHARFLREALITSQLQHPAIVPVYEAGYWPNGAPFYAIRFRH